MKEIKGNLFDFIGKKSMICITTNGFVKSNGECVMGAGCAKEIKTRYPTVPNQLGKLIKKRGNHVHSIGIIKENTRLVSFPVKHNWWEKADIKLIIRSAKELVQFINKIDYKEQIIIPRPGCGCGKLKWYDVKQVLNEILDDRFTIITF